MHRRRSVALAAIFAIAFGALWPLVSAAKPKTGEIPSFICAQSGGAPHAPAPGDASDDFHCPLCIASADVVPQSTAIVPLAPLQLECAALVGPRCAEHGLFTPGPPPSRAPPALS